MAEHVIRGAKYACCLLSGQGTRDECLPLMLWTVRETASNGENVHIICAVVGVAHQVNAIYLWAHDTFAYICIMHKLGNRFTCRGNCLSKATYWLFVLLCPFRVIHECRQVLWRFDVVLLCLVFMSHCTRGVLVFTVGLCRILERGGLNSAGREMPRCHLGFSNALGNLTQ